jgi:hypothetical protein
LPETFVVIVDIVPTLANMLFTKLTLPELTTTVEAESIVQCCTVVVAPLNVVSNGVATDENSAFFKASGLDPPQPLITIPFMQLTNWAWEILLLMQLRIRIATWQYRK